MMREEQKVAIAEVCGWMSIQKSGRLDGQLVGYPPNGLLKRQEIPDYLADLNATHTMEGCLSIPQSAIYEQTLEHIVNAPFFKDETCMVWPTWRATAAQRAEAFLKTLNLWKE